MLGLWVDKKRISYRVVFDSNCRYDLGNNNQLDINKLFGIGFLWSHHTDSARFGWRYNNDTKKFELFTYCYVSGKRTWEYITSVEPNVSCELTIDLHFGSYFFTIKRGSNIFQKEVKHFHTKKIAYPLAPYFGGDEKAPHTMNIYLYKL